ELDSLPGMSYAELQRGVERPDRLHAPAPSATAHQLVGHRDIKYRQIFGRQVEADPVAWFAGEIAPALDLRRCEQPDVNALRVARSEHHRGRSPCPRHTGRGARNPATCRSRVGDRDG